jgi:Spy/CpxP family protein refolding chaperone
MKKGSVTIGLLLVVASTGLAGQEAGGFEQFLFPPELVMQHQRAIDLTPEQRSVITQAITALQSRVIELQWDMQSENERLAELARSVVVDEEAVLAQMDRVLDIENQVKRAHLMAIVRIKNALTEDQQRQLQELRERRDDDTRRRREDQERRRPRS